MALMEVWRRLSKGPHAVMPWGHLAGLPHTLSVILSPSETVAMAVSTTFGFWLRWVPVSSLQGSDCSHSNHMLGNFSTKRPETPRTACGNVHATYCSAGKMLGCTVFILIVVSLLESLRNLGPEISLWCTLGRAGLSLG